jgi:putative SOS response-associated peptidase YedK
MCNLYKMRRTIDEVARHFGIKEPPAVSEFNTPEETLPGYPGLVMREQEGKRVLQSMVWGFPLRLRTMKPDAKPLAVNNIADLNKPMWKGLAAKPQWRCLIPLTEFAEAEGPKGARTRTWVTIKDRPLVAWAGLWRISDEWGPVYSGVMTDANQAMSSLHDRMPVLLHADEYERWLHCNFDEAVAFQQRIFPDDLIEMNRTQDLWVSEAARKAMKDRAAAKKAAKEVAGQPAGATAKPATANARKAKA